MLESDEKFMQMALDLAWRGAGLASPNPMVGAVVVRDGDVVGKGYHLYGQLKHAEAYALADAGAAALGATLYCNLEPCCHQGRTPPCTGAIIDAGISRAVVAIHDPDSRVSGRGIAQLRDAGIAVELGVCESRALELNETYLKYITTGRPFIHSVLLDINAAGTVPKEPGQNAHSAGRQERGPLIGLASTYDAIGLGTDPSLNLSIVSSAIALRRHRPLVVLGAKEHVASLAQSLGSDSEDKISPILVETNAETDRVEKEGAEQSATSPDRYLKQLAAERITSLLVLPSAAALSELVSKGQVDRTTII